MAMPAHLRDVAGSPPRGGANAERKEAARRRVRDVALELIAERGFEATTVEQIAAVADISVATFFRYFGTKGEVVFNDPEQWLPDLWRAVIERPETEGDLEAVRHGLQEAWVPRTERGRSLLQARAIRSSPVLHGLSAEKAIGWRAVLADALARRRQLSVADADCELGASLVVTLIGAASDAWLGDESTDLATALDRTFERFTSLCCNWSGDGPRAEP
jgi:AcrR family transcriptional regulator